MHKKCNQKQLLNTFSGDRNGKETTKPEPSEKFETTGKR